MRTVREDDEGSPPPIENRASQNIPGTRASSVLSERPDLRSRFRFDLLAMQKIMSHLRTLAPVAVLPIVLACSGDVVTMAPAPNDAGTCAPSEPPPDPLPCETLFDCPKRDCSFWACNDGACVAMADKPEDSPCSIFDECGALTERPGFCKANACEPGCDFATDCPFVECTSSTCSDHLCAYTMVPDCP